jgi:hypothetical protein
VHNEAAIEEVKTAAQSTGRCLAPVPMGEAMSDRGKHLQETDGAETTRLEICLDILTLALIAAAALLLLVDLI